MNDSQMTIVGNVVDHPKLRRTKSGHWVTNFRVASTPRRFDRESGTWVDGSTLFVTVTAWRSLGENVADSLHKGQPVIVFGRYCQREYERDEKLHTAYELEAITIGHDLNRGVASFERKTRAPMAAEVSVDDEGRPADESDHYLPIEETEGGEVDTDTGEVLEYEHAS